ncbi:hypothetical protein ACU19_04910 [Actinobaculum suis]|nr:hypothetical protein ACU19_04910 [Actinobaculum suis]
MTDQCKVTRVVIINRKPAYAAAREKKTITVYEGPFRVRVTSPNAAVMPDAGGMTVMQQDVASFPIDVVLQKGDTITVTAGDPQLVGASFTVRGRSPASQATAAKYQVESVM